ncbi:D-glycero-beta-D-manno-heptose-7-phosphate kinase [Desulfobacterota bacterium AH_259_B03_O07]|nr:D-glycero-beta-D-manno-heptose-7-phosphate kinase [Desulfobacterota bacterium AH_259_B03_O07]
MHISSIVKRYNKKRIMVVGDIMLDRYIFGTVSKISPEAPVPILKSTEEEISLGGAANVAANLKSLGASVDIFGVIGNDSEGKRVSDLLKRSSIKPKGLVVDSSRATTTKTRLVTRNQQVARIDKEKEDFISNKIQKMVLSTINRHFDKHFPDGIIISDYKKGCISKDLCEKIIQLAREHKIFLVVDPKGDDFTKYKGASVITPNKVEAESVCGFPIDDEKTLKKAFEKLVKITRCEGVLITRGKDGISYYKKGGKIHTKHSDAREIFDVTGAGDTVVSVFMLSYLASGSWDDSVQIANKAAGIVVSKLGTSKVSPRELIENFNNNTDNTSQKVVSRQELSRTIKVLRNNGKKIAFTNGCFDLFHSGHLKLLREAKSFGDILIVGINSDISARRLKGKQRPFISEYDRAKILSALDCVDFVVIFNEDTPLKLIKALKPSVMIKGDDYMPQAVVGRDFVESYGGKVQLVKLVDGISTTKLVNKIRSEK